MTEMKYSKEDLLWEAVRRNEKYKKYFNSFNKCFPDENYNRFYGLKVWPILDHWKLLRLYDPSIDIDQIKAEIKKDPIVDHPYNHLFKKSEPVLYHGVPGSKYYNQKSGSRYDFEDQDDKSVCIKKNIIMNRLVISIDPMAPNSELLKLIKEVKSRALHVKDIYELATQERLNKITDKYALGRYAIANSPYNSAKINSYMGWLKKYDQVINYCRTKSAEVPNSKKYRLRNHDGVITITANFNFKEMYDENKEENVNKDVDKKEQAEDEKIDDARRTWLYWYREAVKLIMLAPNITFSSSKKSALNQNIKTE